MSVHYKFKSALEYDSVAFDGLHISVKDLKKAIIDQKKIGKQADYDLQVTNAQTKEVYTDENALIQKNTSLIIARIPLTAQQKRQLERDNLIAAGVKPSDVDATLAKSLDLTNEEMTEEDKIKAMMSQSTSQYDPANYVKIKGGNQTGPVPANYVCFKCHNKGHWIKDCPSQLQIDDSDVGVTEIIKRSTGIPRSFMIPVDGPQVQGARMTPGGEFAVPVIDHEVYKEKKIEKPPFVGDDQKPAKKEVIPDELVCGICKDLLQDAVMVPCCGISFCDDCIRTVLLESEDAECPDCNEKEVSPDTLIPNRFLRNAVNNFRNQTGYVKEMKSKQKVPTPPRPSLPDFVPPSEVKETKATEKEPDKEPPPPPTQSVKAIEDVLPITTITSPVYQEVSPFNNSPFYQSPSYTEPPRQYPPPQVYPPPNRPPFYPPGQLFPPRGPPPFNMYRPPGGDIIGNVYTPPQYQPPPIESARRYRGDSPDRRTKDRERSHRNSRDRERRRSKDRERRRSSDRKRVKEKRKSVERKSQESVEGKERSHSRDKRSKERDEKKRSRSADIEKDVSSRDVPEKNRNSKEKEENKENFKNKKDKKHEELSKRSRSRERREPSEPPIPGLQQPDHRRHHRSRTRSRSPRHEPSYTIPSLFTGINTVELPPPGTLPYPSHADAARDMYRKERSGTPTVDERPPMFDQFNRPLYPPPEYDPYSLPPQIGMGFGPPNFNMGDRFRGQPARRPSFSRPRYNNRPPYSQGVRHPGEDEDAYLAFQRMLEEKEERDKLKHRSRSPRSRSRSRSPKNRSRERSRKRSRSRSFDLSRSRSLSRSPLRDRNHSPHRRYYSPVKSPLRYESSRHQHNYVDEYHDNWEGHDRRGYRGRGRGRHKNSPSRNYEPYTRYRDDYTPDRHYRSPSPHYDRSPRYERSSREREHSYDRRSRRRSVSASPRFDERPDDYRRSPERERSPRRRTRERSIKKEYEPRRDRRGSYDRMAERRDKDKARRQYPLKERSRSKSTNREKRKRSPSVVKGEEHTGSKPKRSPTPVKRLKTKSPSKHREIKEKSPVKEKEVKEKKVEEKKEIIPTKTETLIEAEDKNKKKKDKERKKKKKEKETEEERAARKKRKREKKEEKKRKLEMKTVQEKGKLEEIKKLEEKPAVLVAATPAAVTTAPAAVTTAPVVAAAEEKKPCFVQTFTSLKEASPADNPKLLNNISQTVKQTEPTPMEDEVEPGEILEEDPVYLEVKGSEETDFELEIDPSFDLIPDSDPDPDKKDILAPVPEKSKWERDESIDSKPNFLKTKYSPDKVQVTSEVLKRAENAIFKRAINSIKVEGEEKEEKKSVVVAAPVKEKRPEESTSSRRIFIRGKEKESRIVSEVSKPKSEIKKPSEPAMQITVTNEKSSKPKPKLSSSLSKPEDPPRISVKNRLGVKLESSVVKRKKTEDEDKRVDETDFVPIYDESSDEDEVHEPKKPEHEGKKRPKTTSDSSDDYDDNHKKSKKKKPKVKKPKKQKKKKRQSESSDSSDSERDRKKHKRTKKKKKSKH